MGRLGRLRAVCASNASPVAYACWCPQQDQGAASSPFNHVHTSYACHPLGFGTAVALFATLGAVNTEWGSRSGQQAPANTHPQPQDPTVWSYAASASVQSPSNLHKTIYFQGSKWWIHVSERAGSSGAAAARGTLLTTLTVVRTLRCAASAAQHIVHPPPPHATYTIR